MKKIIVFTLLVSFLFVNGCALVFQKGRSSDLKKIESLKEKLDEFANTKSLLEERLSQEIRDKKVSLTRAEKGLVITFVAEILFDSGKAVLREDSLPILDKVVRILKEEVPQNSIGVEGHTDNEPIKHSKWQSNWELSAHRALGVLYYLESEGVSPMRLSAIGYGEYHPVASNDTDQGKQLNRRVEIVILPKAVKKIEKGSSSGGSFDDEELK